MTKGLEPLTRIDPRLPGEYLDSFYASLSAAVTAIGSTVGTLRISTANFPNGATCTVPATLTLDPVGNGSILMTTGQTVTINSDTANWPIRKLFYNAQAGQGTVKLLGRITDSGYMEWWGASPTASAATNTPAVQAALTSMAMNGTNPSGNWIYNRTVKFLGMYEVNDELDVYHMIGFRWEGQTKFNSGIRQTAANKRIIDGQSVSYGVFSNLIFQGGASSNTSLIDLDYDGSQGSDLRGQNITFYDCVIQNNAFVGNFATGHIGVHIAKAGSGAQGDNIRFYNCYANGFMEAAVQLGTPTQFAQNAIHVEWIGGDIQGCPKYGLAAYGGSFIVKHPTFENGNVTSADGVQQTGFDLYSSGSVNVNVVEDVRSEGLRFASGAWNIKNCTLLGPSTTLVGAGWPITPGTTSFVNQLITGSVYGGDGKMYLVSNIGTFGGLQTTSATGGSLTTVVKTGAGWTVNAFVGQRVTIMTGLGKYQYGVITSNDATTLTCSAGFVSDYLVRADTGLPVLIVAPDATSTFLIEPDWGAAPTSSGTVNFALLEIFALDGRVAGSSDPLVNGLNGSVEGFNAGLGTRLRMAATSSLSGATVTRQDWFDSNTSVLDGIYPHLRLDNILVVRYLAAAEEYLPWSIPRNAYTGTFRDYSQKQQGNQWSIWSRGDVGGGVGWVDLGIGRGDGIANNDGSAISRNVLGFLGTLGRKTPAGTNQAGTATRIQGGLSTGSGIEGALELWLGSAGSTGSAVNAGTKAASLTRADGFMLDKTLPLQIDGGFSARWIRKSIQEEITLNTGSTTTDSTADMLPADAIIEAVVAVISVGVTTATAIQIGDTTTASRFISSFSGMGAGFKRVGLNHRKGSVTTDAAGPTQTSAAKIRITTDVNPGAGKVNVIVFYSQFVAPSA